jgi:type IV secretion system protein VirD4
MTDEFPALGKLEILQQSLAFVAGYGIKCYLIAQDINQLKSRETGYGPDESITSNCQTDWKQPSTSQSSPDKRQSSKNRLLDRAAGS